MNLLMENIQRQLLEIESLKCTYFCGNEFKILNENSITDRELFLKNELSMECLDSIDLEIDIKIDGTPTNIRVEVPVEYPDMAFSAQIRCTAFNRDSHSRINCDAIRFISESDRDSVSVTGLIDWLRDRLSSYLGPTGAAVEPDTLSMSVATGDSPTVYSRLWIYSHHLYSSTKKKIIKDWCRELALSGFFLSGKPGIVCVEGARPSTQSFWRQIRSLGWKRLVLKEEETVTLDPRRDAQLHDWKKFSDFREVTFVASPDSADFSLFFKWLKELGCAAIIPVLFGLDVQ